MSIFEDLSLLLAIGQSGFEFGYAKQPGVVRPLAIVTAKPLE